MASLKRLTARDLSSIERALDQREHQASEGTGFPPLQEEEQNQPQEQEGVTV